MLLMANAGVVTATHAAAPETSARLVAYMLQAFTTGASGPLPAPPTPRHIYRARRRLQRGHQGGK